MFFCIDNYDSFALTNGHITVLGVLNKGTVSAITIVCSHQWTSKSTRNTQNRHCIGTYDSFALNNRYIEVLGVLNIGTVSAVTIVLLSIIHI